MLRTTSEMNTNTIQETSEGNAETSGKIGENSHLNLMDTESQDAENSENINIGSADDRNARDNHHEQEHEILVSLSVQSLNDDVEYCRDTLFICIVFRARPWRVLSLDVARADVTVTTSAAQRWRGRRLRQFLGHDEPSCASPFSFVQAGC